MNLSELKHLKYISETLPGYCHQQAEKQLDAALRWIDSSQTASGPDQGKLQLACAALLDAMRYHQQDIRPSLALAYAFSLLDQEDMALACLSNSLRLDPQNPLVVSLLHNLRPSEEPLFVPRQVVLSPAESEALSVRLEPYLVSRVMRINQHPAAQLDPAASGERARTLLRAILEVRSISKEAQLRLQPLAEHPSRPLLHRQLQAIETPLRQLEQKYCLCGEYRLLQKAIEVTLNACRRLAAEFSRHLASGTLAIEIEVLGKNRAAFAAKLQSLAQAEEHAPELILLYQCLSEQIEDLQDRHAHSQSLPIARSA